MNGFHVTLSHSAGCHSYLFSPRKENSKIVISCSKRYALTSNAITMPSDGTSVQAMFVRGDRSGKKLATLSIISLEKRFGFVISVALSDERENNFKKNPVLTDRQVKKKLVKE